MKTIYKKRAVPAAVRRAVALKHGCSPGRRSSANCAKCGKPGFAAWPTLYKSNRPGAWVSFVGLELDHILPEVHGGASVAANMQLLCRRCNRKKGFSQ
jgi:5-methylcytosine-specific restriction endonuclease McrA